MKKKKKQFKFSNWKKILLILIILFCSAGIAYAGINNILNGFKALIGGKVEINAHSVCKKVINNRGEEVFVPTKTSNEWSMFRTNLPTKVSLNDCYVAPVVPTPPVCTAWDRGECISYSGGGSSGDGITGDAGASASSGGASGTAGGVGAGGGGNPTSGNPADAPGYGGASSGAGGISVLCTEARARGMISEEMYLVDKTFGEENMGTAVMRGYHSWAIPLVRIIKNNNDLADAILPLAVEWTKHIAYNQGLFWKDSEIGRTLFEVGIPLCEELGAMMLEDGNLDYEFSKEYVEREITKYLGDFRLKDMTIKEAKIQLEERLAHFLAKAKETYTAEKR